jgi:1-aminocyclopropane-1-carboxylate deaminase/D-cysteine desulfhydrase-like pyridoxal-dependent ACC family enzyme
LRAHGWTGRALGICVRRPAAAQAERVIGHCAQLAALLGVENPVRPGDVEVSDAVLAPGYGIMNTAVADAIRDCARLDGLLVEPVYTGRAMAGLFAHVRDGRLPAGTRVAFLHTGGLPALFGYERDLRRMV